MIHRNITFVSPVSTNSPFFSTNRIKKVSVTRRRCRPCYVVRQCPHASKWTPNVPNSIKQLDELHEEEQHEHLETVEPLPEEVEQFLFDKFPSIAEVDKALDKAVAESDYDSLPGRPYTWTYLKFTPWRPSRVLQAIFVLIPLLLARQIWLVLRARYSLVTIAKYLVQLDNISNGILLVAIPLLLTARLLPISRSDTRTDGVRRSLLMLILSSTSLLPIAATAATGNIMLALTSGIAVRLGPITMALWYWRDLRREIMLSPLPRSFVFRICRMLITLLVIICGSFLRFGAIYCKDLIPLRTIMESSAIAVRKAAGRSFPIALSLCNDPRGLFFGACIFLTGYILYGMFLLMFGIEFFQKKDHRACSTPIINLMVKYGIFQPNRHPEEEISALSGGHPPQVYKPSRAMMLRHNEDLVGTDTSLPSTEACMPIETYLEREAEVMAEEGATEWSKSRTEQVPLTADLTDFKRSMDGLLNWAKPLPEADLDLSFAEYFETLEENEYVYDPLSQNWVFDDLQALDEGPVSQESLKEPQNGVEPSGADLGESEEIAKDLEPWIHKMMQDEVNKHDDDKNDPPQSVFV